VDDQRLEPLGLHDCRSDAVCGLRGSLAVGCRSAYGRGGSRPAPINSNSTGTPARTPAPRTPGSTRRRSRAALSAKRMRHVSPGRGERPHSAQVRSSAIVPGLGTARIMPRSPRSVRKPAPHEENRRHPQTQNLCKHHASPPPASRPGMTQAHAAGRRVGHSGRAASTCSGCPSGFTLCITFARFPSASITNVERLTPQYFLPPKFFSAQTP
jgi:hypothetical protein